MERRIIAQSTSSKSGSALSSEGGWIKGEDIHEPMNQALL